jgi:hypothetical protein
MLFSLIHTETGSVSRYKLLTYEPCRLLQSLFGYHYLTLSLMEPDNMQLKRSQLGASMRSIYHSHRQCEAILNPVRFSSSTTHYLCFSLSLSLEKGSRIESHLEFQILMKILLKSFKPGFDKNSFLKQGV